MKKYLLASVALVGMASVAHAADDSLSMYGLTLYGTVDVGVAYQNHGAPLNDYFPAGLDYVLSKSANKSTFTLAPNGMSQSKIGVKGQEELIDGWYGIFKLETGFNPTSGELSDGPRSLVQQNGIALNRQTSSGDSSRAGQPFQGAAYAGIDNKTYGTVTFGRQNSLLLDNVIKYDPQGGSYAFSPLGFSGVTGGVGDTQDARLDNSIRYGNRVGPVRFGAMYQFGGQSTGASGAASGYKGNAYEFNLGADYHHASIDALYSHKKDAIAAASLTAAQVAGLPALGISPDTALAATASDNTAYTFMASYDFGAPKVFAGYEFIRYSNPTTQLTAGTTDIGGYTLAYVNNTAYNRNRVLQVMWAGAKYAITPKFDVTGAYYRYQQPSYANVKCSDARSAQCSGAENFVSLSVDYKLSKRFDVYAGAMWSAVENGLANGYLNSATIDPMVGVRFSF